MAPFTFIRIRTEQAIQSITKIVLGYFNIHREENNLASHFDQNSHQYMQDIRPKPEGIYLVIAHKDNNLNITLFAILRKPDVKLYLGRSDCSDSVKAAQDLSTGKFVSVKMTHTQTRLSLFDRQVAYYNQLGHPAFCAKKKLIKMNKKNIILLR
jgi:hypothetical protein